MDAGHACSDRDAPGLDGLASSKTAAPSSHAEPGSSAAHGAAASLPPDLLGAVFHLLLKGGKKHSWDPRSVRQVCTHWLACYDEQLLREATFVVEEQLCLPAGEAPLQSWLRTFRASRTAALLGRAHRLRLHLRCEVCTEEVDERGKTISWSWNGEDDPSTYALNKAVMQAAASLVQLDLTLTASLADEVDSLLPRGDSLTSLCVGFRPFDCCLRSETEYCQPGSLAALVVGLRHLPMLQELVVRQLPADPFFLSMLAPSLPCRLTRLELRLPDQCDLKVEECSGTLQQLGCLPRLRHLRLSTILTGCASNTVPAGLSLLTCLEVCGATEQVGALDSSLALMPHLQRLSWEDTGMLYLGWPGGIAALTRLTYLSLGDPILLSVEQHEEPPAPPPSLAGHTRLAHLHVGGRGGERRWALPDLRPLAATLRCLRCGSCEGGRILQALPSLSHLTALHVHDCPPWPLEGAPDLSHMNHLQSWSVPEWWGGAFMERCPEAWPDMGDLWP